MNKQHFNAAVKFGDRLITTGDLDPVYIAVAEARLTKAERARWLVAYSCLYHLASSVFIAQFQGKAFWDKMYEAAVNRDLYWPRGSERRHWRGKTSIVCTEGLRTHWPNPETIAEYWCSGVTAYGVMKRVQEFAFFGPWISFKVADLAERVMNYPVDFSNFELGIYSEPRKGAALLLTGDQEEIITDGDLNLVVQELRKKLGHYNAPPVLSTGKTRKVNIQEIETVLCKYKSHVNGHYPPGKDTKEVHHGLQDLKFDCTLVGRMRRAVLPLMEEWK